MAGRPKPPRRRRTVGERVFALLLRLYPREFRDRHERDLSSYYRDDRLHPRYAGVAGKALFWLHTIADVVRTAISERWLASSFRLGRPTDFLDTLTQDLRYGVRFLYRRRAVTGVAVFVLGLGISLTATMSSIIEGILFSGPDFEALDRIASLETTIPQSQFNQAVRIHDYLDWRDQQSVFTDMSAYYTFSAVLSGEEGPAQQYAAVGITSSTFGLLRTQVLMGRPFTPEEDHLDAQDVIILGHHVWEQRYAADPDIIGRTIRVNARPVTVVGVMPPGFRFPETDDVWLPLAVDPGQLGRRDGPALAVLGRLADGQTIGDAQTQLEAIAARLELAYPEDNANIRPVVETWMEAEFADEASRDLLYVMFAAVVGVLLIACANVANVLFATTIARGKEFAVRTALGAARGRVLRQLLSETLLLALGGAIFGLSLSKVSLALFRRVVEPLQPEPWITLALSPAVFAVALGATCFAGLASGLLPAVYATRADLHPILQDHARGSSSRSVGRWNTALVVVEVALSCALLAGSALMTHSTLRVTRSDYGLDRTDVLTARIQLPAATYADSPSQSQVAGRLHRRIAALPGVTETALSSALPVLGTSLRFYGVRDHDYADDRNTRSRDSRG